MKFRGIESSENFISGVFNFTQCRRSFALHDGRQASRAIFSFGTINELHSDDLVRQSQEICLL